MRKSMLEPWVRGNESITPKNFLFDNNPDFSKGAFIAFDECIDLYKANEFDSGNLETSWKETRDYVYKAMKLVDIDLNECELSLDNEEKAWILEELGEPPLGSYNIYIITIYNETEEKVVYIGKTDSKNSRFSNGHLAALKLNNPIYDSFKKRVYFGTIVLLNRHCNYLPLEYIEPLEKAKNILSSIEKLLINYFKPELNKQNIHSAINLIETTFHIQNFTGTQLFKGDKFIF